MKKLSPLIFILFGVLASQLVTLPETLDQPESIFSYFGSFLLFLFFWLSLVGFGQKLENTLIRKTSQSIGIHLLLGSVFFAITLGFSVLLIPILWMKQWCFALACLGCLFLNLSIYQWEWRESGVISLLSVILLSSVTLRTIESFKLARHGDAFICYLTANRKLVSTGGFEVFLNHPVYFFSSIWEYLYLWGDLFFYHGANTGLAASQRFAQWCSALIAHAGMISVAYSFGKKLYSRSGVALVAALSVSTVPVMRWMQNLAKNDYGIAFWGFGACFLLHLSIDQKDRSKTSRTLLATGVLLGTAIIGKISAIVICIPVCVFLLSHRISIQKWILVGVGGFLGALPILMRNFKLTRNPFFPWLNELFLKQNILGPSLQNSFTSLNSLHQAGVKKEFFLEPILQQPWIFGLFIFLFYFIWMRVTTRKTPSRIASETAQNTIIWVIGSILGCLFYALFLRPRTELRYLGPTLELTSFISIIALAHLIYSLKKGSGFLISCLLIWVLLSSSLSFFTLAQIVRGDYSSGTSIILEHSGGHAKKWLRDHLQPKEKVLAIGDNEEYYMSDYEFHEMSYVRDLDQDLTSIQDGAKMIEYLKNEGYAFVDDHQKQMPWGNLNPRLAKQLTHELEKDPSRIVFKNESATIYSLKR